MNDRLKEIRNFFKMSQEEFGNKIGIASRAHISSLESGVRNITDRIVKDVCREFGVDEDWLRTGKGTMFPPKTEDEKLASLTGKLFSEDNDFKKRMIGLMLEMSEDEWELVEKFIDRLVDVKLNK